MKFMILPYHAVEDHIKATAKDLYDESFERKERDAFAVNWDYYHALSLSGNLLASIALIEEERRIVAYAVYSVSVDPLHGELQAANDVFYVDKEHRGKMPLQFLRKSDELLKDKGINNISYVLSDERLGKLLARAGYKPTHTVWSTNNV